MSTGKKNLVAAALFFALSLLVVVGLGEVTPLLETLELRNYDFMMALLRGPVPAPSDVVIVAVDESSISEYGPTPWPRSLYADLIRRLNEAGVSGLFFDLLWDIESVPEEDAALADAIAESRAPVVLAAALDVVDAPRLGTTIRRLLPLQRFVRAGAKEGFVIFNFDSDGVIRRGRLSAGGRPTFAVQALEQIGRRLERMQLPVVDFEGEDASILINYVGGSRRIRTVSFYQALDPERWLRPEFFKDKFVFIGYSRAAGDISEAAISDYLSTPFEGQDSEARMAGVEVHANLFDTLFRERYLRRVGPLVFWVLLLALGAAVSLSMMGPRTLRLKLLLCLILLLVFVAVGSALFLNRYWVLMVQPVALMLLVAALNTVYQYRTVERERAFIRRALSGYVSRQVMDQVLEAPERLELGGVQVEATVLFSDIAGFSGISEQISARELASQLNDYFTEIGNVIMERDGMINKYIGDAVMALWNVPLSDPRHAARASEAALRMREVVAERHPALKTRIGINTGTMVAGNLGHRQRMEYTVIGDAVNLASRLEGANKAYGTSILISEATYKQLDDGFMLRRVDHIRVAGKQEPVAIYELLAPADSPDGDRIRPMVESFQEVLDCYEARSWPTACRRLEAHLDRFPDDSVAGTYLDRCRIFCETPPPPDWEGVYSLKSK